MRTPVRVLGFLLAAVVTFVLSSGAAWADAPVGDAWPDGPDRSALDLLIRFGGSVIGLIVVIALFGALTARNNYVPPPPGTELERAPHH